MVIIMATLMGTHRFRHISVSTPGFLDDHRVLGLGVRVFMYWRFWVGFQFLAVWYLVARVILFDLNITNYHKLVYHFT